MFRSGNDRFDTVLMDRDRETQCSQREAESSNTLLRRSNGGTSLADWSAGWVQNHRMLSRVVAWFLASLAVAWALTAWVDARRTEWGPALYFTVTSAAAAVVCWWLLRQASRDSKR